MTTGNEPGNEQRRSLMIGGLAAAAGIAALGTGAAAAQAPSRPAPERLPLAGRVAFVTGAARGIGRASALALSRAGARVALVDIGDADAMLSEIGYPLASREELEASAAAVVAAGGEAIPLLADVRDIAQLRAAVDETLRRFGGIDIVAAIAGVGVQDDDFAHYDPERTRHVIDVNGVGVLNTVHAAWEPLKRSAGGGRVVVLSSQAARIGEALPAYGTSKFAATGVVKNLAVALGPDNIRVNALAPSMVETGLPYFQNRLPRNEASRRSLTERLGRNFVLPLQMLDVDLVAEGIVMLAGPMTEATTGITFDINGGLTAQTPS
ncbi:SDR family oxidoreductase [Stenotrophomonas sp. MMGLT7]|uniref:SDR family NAD(P)-dependent oxidoreductase n=1 Tax=Stenotrophomonas sp. MMGLT7 TaxID=2901227 RepID=UPI001E4D4D15|nr:SDR family oxidoreductase [Stenotrophomonas sp. MMGLT7]MCD7098355.1 SDR family oxidoreductase [Stenotrophomonas sp. MMGLT7]